MTNGCVSHGYPILFLDRQTVLRVLYDNLKDRTKVLTGKRVKRIELDGNQARAITIDDSTYSGDIIVGADGIHSTVRDEMWRIADELSPGYISSSEHSGQLKSSRLSHLMNIDQVDSCSMRLRLYIRHFQSVSRN